MELTPQTLHSVEFREARRGGYNTRDVDDFIERVAAGVGHLNERVRSAEARAEAADGRIAEMQREVDEARRRPMAPEVSDTDETLRRTLVLAQRTADATIKEAKEEANRVLSEAREEAARTRAEAEAEARRGADSARVTAQAEVETLLANRDKLTVDIERLNKRLGEQRSHIQSGITELQRLLDDPGKLKPAALPPLADVQQPTPLGPVDATAGGNGTVHGGSDVNGHGIVDTGSPFGPSAQFAALQEPPAPPSAVPPTQPVPFALNGDGREPWLPSELRPPLDEPLGPAPMPAPPVDFGDEPGLPPTPDPDSRPSDWGKAVFDPEGSDPDGTRFGRRR
ncbi:MAG TPA: DivIVA domain-containing protein [Acidimicrobiales bacterium]|nr:DivIVA domain-containing protein [Acidimicrobiales bacterium]